MEPITVTKTWFVFNVAEPHNLKSKIAKICAYVSNEILYNTLKIPPFSLATISPYEKWPERREMIFLNALDQELPRSIKKEIEGGAISLPEWLMEDIEEKVVVSSDLTHILYNSNIKTNTKLIATVNYLLNKKLEK